MNRILVVAEHDGQRLNVATAKCVACAAVVPGSSIDVVVLGQDPQAIAEAAARISGVARVLVCDQAANASPIAAVLAPQVAALVASHGHTHVFGPSTTFGKDLLPRVAALLHAPQVSDIMAVDSARRFRRPVYAGNAIVTVEVAEGVPVVGTVRTASWTAAGTGGNATVEAVTTGVDLPTHTRYVGLAAGNSDRPDLQTATRVVSGGRALGSPENFRLIQQLADALGAAVGASRAAVDAGYAPNELQVGQTGKIIAPELYIALGISGAIQHMTGIKDARTIVAINKDPDAAIFEAADLGLVGDLFTAIPELIAKLPRRPG
jgi:electron transfer flavoprotein alpha subunit